MSIEKNLPEPKPFIAFDGVTQGPVILQGPSDNEAGHTKSFPTSPDGFIGGLPRPQDLNSPPKPKEF